MPLKRTNYCLVLFGLALLIVSAGEAAAQRPRGLGQGAAPGGLGALTGGTIELLQREDVRKELEAKLRIELGLVKKTPAAQEEPKVEEMKAGASKKPAPAPAPGPRPAGRPRAQATR